MNLSDTEILDLAHGYDVIQPFDASRVQPASYDLTLYPELLVPRSGPNRVLDLRCDDPSEYVYRIDMGDRYLLRPGQAVLGCTVETLHIPNNLLARVEGKSTLGRIFLAVHVTAGFVDPGFKGQITLEIVNHGPWTVAIYPGMTIAQVNFAKMEGEVQKPYGSQGLGSHYAGQMGPKAAVGMRGPVK